MIIEAEILIDLKEGKEKEKGIGKEEEGERLILIDLESI